MQAWITASFASWMSESEAFWWVLEDWNVKLLRNISSRQADIVMTSSKWKQFRRCWPFVRVIKRPSVNSSHKGQWWGALMFSLISAWANSWGTNGDAGDRAHCDVTIMWRFQLNFPIHSAISIPAYLMHLKTVSCKVPPKLRVYFPFSVVYVVP